MSHVFATLGHDSIDDVKFPAENIGWSSKQVLKPVFFGNGFFFWNERKNNSSFLVCLFCSLLSWGKERQRQWWGGKCVAYSRCVAASFFPFFFSFVFFLL